MKKTYIAPELRIVQLRAVRLMQTFSGKLDRYQSIEDASGFGSRRGGFWYDDDEEE